MKYDLVIRESNIVLGNEIIQGDIGIKGEKIAAIGKNIPSGQREIIAQGLYSLPGIIDSHTHIYLDLGHIHTADTWLTGTKAAALGGITTVLDFAPQAGDGSISKGITERIAQTQNRLCVDLGLHATIYRYNSNIPAQMLECVEMGITSFKEFTIYRERGWQSDSAILWQSLDGAKKAGGLITLHAESDSLNEYFAGKLEKEGKKSCKYLAQARPPVGEYEAIQGALAMALDRQAPIYIVHISTALGANAIKEAKDKGQWAFGETCPQYLYLDQDFLAKEKGYLYSCCPPLRPKENLKALENFVKDGALSVIGTDHCPFMAKDKLTGHDDFSKGPFGLPGLDYLLPLTFSKFYDGKPESIMLISKVLSENPAKIFGLYPEKGTLLPGAYGDITVVDADSFKTVMPRNGIDNQSDSDIDDKNREIDNDGPIDDKIGEGRKIQDINNIRSDYSPYSGLSLRGWPQYTILRGNVIVEKGQFTGKAGMGKFWKRKPFLAF